MKLISVNLDRYGTRPNMIMTRLGDRLNVVIEPYNPSEIARLFRDALFANRRVENTSCACGWSREITGTVDVVHGDLPYRLTLPGPSGVSPATAHPFSPSVAVLPADATDGLDAEMYDTFFSWDPESSRSSLSAIARLLHSRFGVALGSTGYCPASNSWQWNAFTDPRRDRLRQLTRQMEELTKAQISMATRATIQPTDNSIRLAELNGRLQRSSVDIERLNAKIRELVHQRDTLDRQIVDLEAQIQQRPRSSSPIVTPPAPERMALLYERLDEIDCQWQRWRLRPTRYSKPSTGDQKRIPAA